METFRCWNSLHGCVLFLFLAAIGEGSACEPPSSPQCFRQNADQTVYTCEWSLNTNESDVTFDLYVDGTKFENIKGNSTKIVEEQLIRTRLVAIWVEAHVGASSCTSPQRSVILEDTVKYETPQNISVAWLKDSLSLSWPAAEKHPVLAEVWFRPYENLTESWEKLKRIAKTTNEALNYQVLVGNLQKRSAYKIQIRQQSSVAKNPLWSNWSPVVIVPAELEHELKVTETTQLVNGGRRVVLTWPRMPHAAAVGGVTYILTDTLSSQGCPCEEKRRKHHTDKNKDIIYVPYSAVNISVIARNAAGSSPPAVVQIPIQPAADLKICDKTLLNEKFNRSVCLQWYELQDADSRPANVTTLSGAKTKKDKKEKEKIKQNVKDYTRYLYFEHRCVRGEGRRPQTVKMCLFYQKEGAPAKEPQDLLAFNEAQSSANLSWKAIPFKDQRGFLTHYKLCRVKISSQDEPEVCSNISVSAVKYRLENLTPGSKYNISLAGVTRKGEGPKATITVNTWPEKHWNVWLSLGLLFIFFSFTIVCTIVLNRIKNKIFPPVPTPVIPDFTPCPKCQLGSIRIRGKSLTITLKDDDMLENKEEVDDLTLYQVHPEVKSLSEEAGGEWDDVTEEDVENKRSDSEGSCDECLSPGSANQALKTDLEQVENELSMLIYRTGLIFDRKTDL